MNTPPVRYDRAPYLVMHYPSCSACAVDLDLDGDVWQCPKCWTTWDMRDTDGDPGELWEEFNEDQPVTSHEDGWKMPWRTHPYEAWVTDDGVDMLRCRKCYAGRSEHMDGGAK